MKGIKFLFIIGICVSVNVHAADEIIVTPGRYAQPLREVVPSVIVIDRETIERSQSVAITDLLRWHAGIDIGRTGGIGQQSSAFIRGANSNHTAVLINGIKMNAATTGAAALEMINTSAIERIEIIKGPRSTVYGSEAISGVINIITTNDELDTKVAVHASRGRYSTSNQGIAVSYAGTDTTGDFSFNRLRSDGFPTTTSSSTDHGHDNDTADINVKTKFGMGELAVSYWQAEGNTEYDSFGVDLDHDRKNGVFNAFVNLSFSDHWQSSFSLSRIKDEIRQNQMNFLDNKDFSFTDRYVYEWKNDISLNNALYIFGMSATDEDTESLSFGTSYKEDTDIYSIYLHTKRIQDKHSLFSSTRYTKHEDFDESITWNVEYGHNFSKQAKLFTSIGTGFTAPNSNARFGFGGNPNLREETSRSIEVGASYAFNPTTQLSIRGYENKFSDLIETILIGPGEFIFENRNVAEARARGIELAWQHQTTNWDFNIEAIVQNPKNETDDSPLLRRAKRSFSGSVLYDYRQFFALVNGLVTSTRRDFGDVVLPGYGLVDVSAGINFANATFSIKIENLFDKEYELASGFAAPGQSVFAELRVKLAQ